ncbi:DNA methylase family protein, putative [Babesia ovis]|uniref:DNA methylase family protein, putative n=1 Tax=Babesia ovis TaxID=5869 RepID=A0A9W5TD22_BABOV|nr:DNA methylase family protein, putative [Babesia ovis]
MEGFVANKKVTKLILGIAAVAGATTGSVLAENNNEDLFNMLDNFRDRHEELVLVEDPVDDGDEISFNPVENFRGPFDEIVESRPEPVVHVYVPDLLDETEFNTMMYFPHGRQGYVEFSPEPEEEVKENKNLSDSKPASKPSSKPASEPSSKPVSRPQKSDNPTKLSEKAKDNFAPHKPSKYQKTVELCNPLTASQGNKDWGSIIDFDSLYERGGEIKKRITKLVKDTVKDEQCRKMANLLDGGRLLKLPADLAQKLSVVESRKLPEDLIAELAASIADDLTTEICGPVPVSPASKRSPEECNWRDTRSIMEYYIKSALKNYKLTKSGGFWCLG